MDNLLQCFVPRYIGPAAFMIHIRPDGSCLLELYAKKAAIPSDFITKIMVSTYDHDRYGNIVRELKV